MITLLIWDRQNAQKRLAEVQTEMYTFTVYSCQTIQCPVQELIEQMGKTSPVT